MNFFTPDVPLRAFYVKYVGMIAKHVLHLPFSPLTKWTHRTWTGLTTLLHSFALVLSCARWHVGLQRLQGHSYVARSCDSLKVALAPQTLQRPRGAQHLRSQLLSVEHQHPMRCASIKPGHRCSGLCRLCVILHGRRCRALH